MSDFNLLPLLPEIFMALVAMGLLIVGVTRVVIAGLFMFGISWDREIVLNGLFVFDSFAGMMKMMIMMGIIVSLSLSVRFLQQENVCRFEYPVLVMFAGIGMMLMVSANNMLSLYMALELQSLSLYVLAAFQRNSYRSSEAGIKYFILGALSSGMLLFGISLIYGFTGSLDFVNIQSTLFSLGLISPGWRGWRLKFPPCRSICGRPTFIRVRRPV